MGEGNKSAGALLAGLLVLLLPVGLILGFIMIGAVQEEDSCAQAQVGTTAVDPDVIPDIIIPGYRDEHLVNAAHIIKAGVDLDVTIREQTIGVMTAIGESGLLVLDYGDEVGPDSRGLFQQRDNGAWGSYTDRMDPYISATNFFVALKTVADRDTLDPNFVAHEVQKNDDPWHYTEYWQDAYKIVEALAGVDLSVFGLDGKDPLCPPETTSTTVVNAEGWSRPAIGPFKSGYGTRIHPIFGDERLHAGVDIGAGCETAIWSAHDGTVIQAGASTGYGYLIVVDHGGGINTRYGHMESNGLLVRPGDQISSGQQIARVGSSGTSTACHLHFEVSVAGAIVNPTPFLKDVGIDLTK